MALSELNNRKNLIVRTTSDGERRQIAHKADKVGDALAKCDTPAAVAKVAKEHGITEEEIVQRGKSAPNFGQFRMVLGNRIRGIKARMAKDKSLTPAQAAYPREHRKTLREASRKSKEKAKTTSGKKKAKTKTSKSATKKLPKKLPKSTPADSVAA